MRKVVCLLGLVFLATVSAAAQDSYVDVFAGYSYLHTSPGVNQSSFKANGGDASIALNVNRWGSLVAEFGGVHTSKISGTDVDATATTLLFGPKFHSFAGPSSLHSCRPYSDMPTQTPLLIEPQLLPTALR